MFSIHCIYVDLHRNSEVEAGTEPTSLQAAGTSFKTLAGFDSEQHEQPTADEHFHIISLKL